ncbi:MAG: hypothetical protein J5I98_30840 [Phaeodactylibacter sp.]|nr:hypothetical protein [Phaeodactylibacter sp.]
MKYLLFLLLLSAVPFFVQGQADTARAGKPIEEMSWEELKVRQDELSVNGICEESALVTEVMIEVAGGVLLAINWRQGK